MTVVGEGGEGVSGTGQEGGGVDNTNGLHSRE